MAGCDFEDPGSLKEILELLEKLNGSGTARSVSGAVSEKLDTEAKKYFKDSHLAAFLGLVFPGASLIRSTILDSSRGYDKYSGLNDTAHTGHSGCAEKISKALKRFLPQGYVALYYLYFMCSNDCSGIGGGTWNSYNVKDSGQKLSKWFTQKRLTPELIRRGFSQGDLDHSNDGQTVAPVIKQIITHDSAGPLQKVLVFLLFSCPWDDALTGHALCFLYTFCSKVSAEGSLEEKLKGYSGKLKTVCQDLQNPLQHFIFGSSHLFAVCQKNTNLFNELWDDEKFEAYVDWLKDHLKDIIESLEAMSSEASNWSISKVQGADNPGPFRFGFVFKNGWQDSTFKTALPSKTSPLTNSNPGSLNELKECLEVSPSST
ncbi:secreted antigen 1, partial [Babesia divergens]